MEYLKAFEQKTNILIEAFKEELAALRANRPTPKLIENIKVDYVGQFLTVKQLGSIHIELPRDLVVTVWDKNGTTTVGKAIEAANLGVGVTQQGNMVRVRLPELTSERRAELVKIVKTAAEEIRIKMRMQRDEANRKVNSEKDEDEKFKAKDELQKLVDTFNKGVESLVENKVKEILG